MPFNPSICLSVLLPLYTVFLLFCVVFFLLFNFYRNLNVTFRSERKSSFILLPKTVSSFEEEPRGSLINPFHLRSSCLKIWINKTIHLYKHLGLRDLLKTFHHDTEVIWIHSKSKGHSEKLQWWTSAHTHSCLFLNWWWARADFIWAFNFTWFIFPSPLP